MHDVSPAGPVHVGDRGDLAIGVVPAFCPEITVIASSLDLLVDGIASLGQRGEKGETGGWDSTEIIDDAPIKDICLTVTVNTEDDEGVSFQISEYHIPETEGERVFHMLLKVFLKREQVAQLHDYLGFLLTVMK